MPVSARTAAYTPAASSASHEGALHGGWCGQPLDDRPPPAANGTRADGPRPSGSSMITRTVSDSFRRASGEALDAAGDGWREGESGGSAPSHALSPGMISA